MSNYQFQCVIIEKTKKTYIYHHARQLTNCQIPPQVIYLNTWQAFFLYVGTYLFRNNAITVKFSQCQKKYFSSSEKYFCKNSSMILVCNVEMRWEQEFLPLNYEAPLRIYNISCVLFRVFIYLKFVVQNQL